MSIPVLPITNPHYGTGVYRRRIRLMPGEGHVCAELEDNNHGFRVGIEHDGRSITGITGDALRTPLSTCPGALARLQRLVGANVHSDATQLSRRADPASNCTHWLDLCILAINHIPRGAVDRQYDVAVTDERDGASELSVHCNGVAVHLWHASGLALTAPEPLAGRTLFRGFSSWARDCFSGDALEAALVLQRGNFVAQARRFADALGKANEPVKKHQNGNVCYSYSAEIVEQAIHRPHSVRDFTETPELLLKFV
tara:strand:+ start:15421 stop:16185 length:765 start_codon:yes stop_codon:yes gene_type:complete